MKTLVGKKPKILLIAVIFATTALFTYKNKTENKQNDTTAQEAISVLANCKEYG